MWVVPEGDITRRWTQKVKSILPLPSLVKFASPCFTREQCTSFQTHRSLLRLCCSHQPSARTLPPLIPVRKEGRVLRAGTDGTCDGGIEGPEGSDPSEGAGIISGLRLRGEDTSGGPVAIVADEDLQPHSLSNCTSPNSSPPPRDIVGAACARGLFLVSFNSSPIPRWVASTFLST